AGMQTLAMMICVSRIAPRNGVPARFDASVLQRLWRFAAGHGLSTVLAVLLTQADKVMLSRLIPLRTFGDYTLAGTVAASLFRLAVPVSQALSPRFAQLVATGDESTLTHVYHRGCQLMSAVVLPVAVSIVFFAPQVLYVWTGNATAAGYASGPLR